MGSGSEVMIMMKQTTSGTGSDDSVCASSHSELECPMGNKTLFVDSLLGEKHLENEDCGCDMDERA